MFYDNDPRLRRPKHGDPSPGYRRRYDSYDRSRQRPGDANPIFFGKLGVQNRRQELYLLLLLVVSLLAWYATPVSDYVAGYVLETIPIESDIQLGREAMKSLSAKYLPVADQWGVERVGRELVAALDRGSGGRHRKANSLDYYAATSWRDSVRRYRWSFGVVRADFANAFALPGGIVRVTDSLLRQIRPTEGELAGLLGHEMGHVLHRHSQRRQVKQNLVRTVLSALTYEDNDGYDESFGEAMGEILLKGAAWLGEQGFSRRDEYQADAAAWDILVETETYDPRSVAGMLAKLWSLEGGNGVTRWESTHPGTADRIKALQKKWEGLDWREQRMLSNFPKG